MTQTTPQKPFFLAWAIWTSFLMSLAALLAMAVLWPHTLGAMFKPGLPIVSLRTYGYIVAILLFPIIGGIRRRMERTRMPASSTVSAAPQKPLSSTDRLAGLVLALALAEFIGIVGFILFLFGDNLQTLYLFVGLSALAMLLHHPKAEDSCNTETHYQNRTR